MNPINLLTLRTRLPGRGRRALWGQRGREREDSARDSLTRLLEFASSWQQIKQHREAVPQTLRALEGEREEEAFSWGSAGGWQ